MKIISKQEFLKSKTKYVKKILQGAVFVYPTDTIYGIGCDATNAKAVNKIRKIKKRDDAPFSVAVPSKKWIKDNCEVSKEAEKWLKKLPGPYTLLLKLKNKAGVAKQVIPRTNILGVRIPNNWFAKIIAELEAPITATSANITTKKHMTSLKDLNQSIAEKVDFIIYDGRKAAKPSTVVDLASKEAKLLKR